MGFDLFDLSNDVAVVIGGTGGLGGAMADALAAAGAKVAVIGRSAERGAERVRAIEAAGGQAFFQSADALRENRLKKHVMRSNKNGVEQPFWSMPQEVTVPMQRCLLGATSANCHSMHGKVSSISIWWVESCSPAKSSGRHGTAQGWEHYQYCFYVGNDSIVTGRCLLRSESSRDKLDPILGKGMGHTGCACECDQPRFFSCRAKSSVAIQSGWKSFTARIADHWTHSDGAIW